MSRFAAGFQLLLFARRFDRAFTELMKGKNFPRYYSVMVLLDVKVGGISQQQICQELFINKSSMVKIVDYLSWKHFVERKPNPLDKRENLIFLTATGRKALRLVYWAMAAISEIAFEDISKNERKNFDRVIDYILSNLRAIAALQKLPN